MAEEVAGETAKGGVKARVPGVLRGRLGTPAAIAGTLAAQYALSYLPETGAGGDIKNVLGRGAQLAGAGMLLGPVGAAAGLAAGTVYGAYENIQEARKPYSQTREYQRVKDEIAAIPRYEPTEQDRRDADLSREMAEQLRQQTALLQDIRTGKGMPVGTADIAGRRQVAALARAVAA